MSNPRIQLRHDTASNWSTANPVLLDGEVGIQKGGAIVPNFDDLSTTSYTLNGTVMSDFNVTQRNIGLITLDNDNTQLVMKARIKIPTTAQNEWNNIYWLGRDTGETAICFFVLLYNNGSWTLRLTNSHYSGWGNADASVPSNMIDTWVDVIGTIRWDGTSNSLYRYTGIKLITDENYTQLNNSSEYTGSVGTCSKPTRFFCKNDGTGSWDIFRGEADLAECSITYGGNILWTGLTTTPTKLKIGDGETAWNDLPYII